MEVFKYFKDIGFLIILLLVIFLLNPYMLAIKSGYAMVAALLVLKGRTLIYNIDRDFLVILAFSFSYTMFNYFGVHRGIQYLIIQATFPPIFYALGKMMVTPKLSSKGVFFLLMSIGFVYSISTLLSIVFDLMQGGFTQTNRLIPSFWGGPEILATGMAGYLIYNSLIPAVLVANRQRLGVFAKVVLLAIYGVTLIVGFRLGSRTLIVIAALSFFISFLYVLYKQSPRANMKLIASFAILILIIYIFVPIDLDSPIFSTLGHRLQNTGAAENTASAGNRTGLWAEGLEKLFSNPLGWKARQHHHNLWLDVPKVAGFIPLFFLLVNNVFCFSSLKKLFSTSGNDIGLNVTFLLYFIATYLLFFTEPIIQGNVFAFVVYCLLLGIMNGFIKSREKIVLDENQ